MKNDYTVYPESYPVFNHPRQYLVTNHVANLDNKSGNQRKFTQSPGLKRVSDNRYSLDPFNLPDIPHQKPNSPLGNYQISHYPTSPLNPEMAQQCNLLYMFRNMNSYQMKKPKVHKNEKIAPKIRKIHFEPEFKKVAKIDFVSQKETICLNCGNLRCSCNECGKATQRVQGRVGTSLDFYMGKGLGEISDYRATRTMRFNKVKEEFLSKTTKRKTKNSPVDKELIRRSLLITPFRSFSRSEDY